MTKPDPRLDSGHYPAASKDAAISADPVKQSRELDRQLAIIPTDKFFTKRTVIIGFLAITLTNVVTYLLTTGNIEKITTSTNEAVTREIPGLERQIERRDETITGQQELLTLSTDWLVYLLNTLRENDLPVPEVIVRPGAPGPPTTLPPTTTIPE